MKGDLIEEYNILYPKSEFVYGVPLMIDYNGQFNQFMIVI